MNYEKSAFLAGIALGRQLKGWATKELWRLDTGSFSVSLGKAAEVPLAPAPVDTSGFGENVIRAEGSLYVGNLFPLELKIPGARLGGVITALGFGPVGTTPLELTVEAAGFERDMITAGAEITINE